MKLKTILCTTMLTLPIGLAHGQGAPSRATPPPTGDAVQGSIGDAIRSGADRATGEVLRGNRIGGAIQQGADQAIRQGAAQQIAPDGRRVYPGGQPALGQTPTLGQTLYRDSSGRLFRQDSFGNRYYVQSSPSMEARTNQATTQSASRPRLGIGIEENEQGVQVTEVSEGSAAAEAGFQSGDVVISANGQKIESTEQLARMVRNADPNAELDMKVKRDGEEQTLTAKLASQQQQDRYSAAKPAMNGSEAGQGMSARLQQLEQEVEQLKATIQDMRQDDSAKQSKQSEKDGQKKETQSSQSSDADAQSKDAQSKDAQAEGSDSEGSDQGDDSSDN